MLGNKKSIILKRRNIILSTEIGGLTFQLSTNKQHMTMEDATQIANEIKHVEGNVDSVEKKVKKSS